MVKGRVILAFFMTAFFVALAWGCDLVEEDRDIEDLFSYYADQENITMRMEGNEQDGDGESLTLISYRDNDKHLLQMSTVEDDEETIFDYYIHFADETLSYWLYLDGDEMDSDTDVPLEDEMAAGLIEAIDMPFFRVGEFDPTWFEDTGTMLELLAEHEETFLNFISDGEYDPERDTLISFEFEITETTYVMEFVLDEDGEVFENVVTMSDIGTTTVELPE